jgi:hypothetical protein
MKIWTENLFHQCAKRIDEVFRPNFHSEREIWTENLFHHCAKRIDEVFRPNFHSERDREKYYKLHFLTHLGKLIQSFIC